MDNASIDDVAVYFQPLLFLSSPYNIIFWARIFKLLRSSRIDSKEPIPPGCVAWCGGPARQSYFYSVRCPHRLFKNSSTVLLSNWPARRNRFLGSLNVYKYGLWMAADSISDSLCTWLSRRVNFRTSCLYVQYSTPKLNWHLYLLTLHRSFRDRSDLPFLLVFLCVLSCQEKKYHWHIALVWRTFKFTAKKVSILIAWTVSTHWRLQS